jgi:ParB family chromosome partitioning protein
MKTDVKEMDIHKIHPNLRAVCDAESIEAICHSLRCCGPMEAIHVWFDGQRFRILDGEKRWRACRHLGISKVPVLVVEPPQSLNSPQPL